MDREERQFQENDGHPLAQILMSLELERHKAK